METQYDPDLDELLPRGDEAQEMLEEDPGFEMWLDYLENQRSTQWPS
jgi:hypothetical protein